MCECKVIVSNCEKTLTVRDGKLVTAIILFFINSYPDLRNLIIIANSESI